MSTGVRRRPRSAAFVTGLGRPSGLGGQRRVPCRLRCRTGGSRASVYIRGVPWCCDGAAAKRMGRRGPVPDCGIPAVVPAGAGRFAFLGGLRKRPSAQAALRGVNAAVVGLLLAALYKPVWTAGITNSGDFVLAAIAFLLLFMWQTPPWLVVILSAARGALLAYY